MKNEEIMQDMNTQIIDIYNFLTPFIKKYNLSNEQLEALFHLVIGTLNYKSASNSMEQYGELEKQMRTLREKKRSDADVKDN